MTIINKMLWERNKVTWYERSLIISLLDGLIQNTPYMASLDRYIERYEAIRSRLEHGESLIPGDEELLKHLLASLYWKIDLLESEREKSV
jgi:hypothetical protein